DYVELEADVTGSKSKITIRPFTLDSFDSIKPILDALREGYTIALINMAPLREKDQVTLKRAIDKIKKTLDANEGDIAGVGDNWLIATPSFASVYRGGHNEGPEEQQSTEVYD
ncbi:cell division protein SepF, partial [Candidatus Woesearchaeota archaeon]|nr:cell division protein SepF [Candidatus Woesearchaeota archaeon]